MSLYLRMAWRNLWRHRRRTLIVVLSIALTLSMMMLYDGLMAGFEQAIYANAIRVLGGNIQVHNAGYSSSTDPNPLLPLENDAVVVETARAQKNVIAASRRIVTGGLASNREGAFPVSIIGIEPEHEQPISLLAQNISSGKFLSPEDRDVVFIGRGLAEAMGVGVGERFTLAGRGTHKQMRVRTMTVGGVFDVDMRDVEKRTVYISLLEAQDLYGLTGKSTEVMVSLEKLGQEDPVVEALGAAFPGYDLSTWKTSYPELQQAVSTKGGVMNIFSVIILFIAGIGILNLLLMAVYERTREIGVLGALGMRPSNISTLFLLEGAFMGVVGVALGIVLGLVTNASLGQVGFDYTQYAGLTEYMALINERIYPTLGVEKLFMRSLTALIISVLAAFYPAHEAASSEPAEALHYV